MILTTREILFLAETAGLCVIQPIRILNMDAEFNVLEHESGEPFKCHDGTYWHNKSLTPLTYVRAGLEAGQAIPFGNIMRIEFDPTQGDENCYTHN